MKIVISSLFKNFDVINLKTKFNQYFDLQFSII